MHNYYDDNAIQFFNSTVELNMDQLYKPFLDKVPSDGSILDAGCGSGRDAVNFQKKGYQVQAFDPSENLIQMAKEKFNFEIQKSTFLDFEFDTKFDGIWSCASLLHVPTDDLPNVFKKFENALKENGIIYASFKYGSFEGERNGRFFNDFTEDSLKEFLAKNSRLRIDHYWVTSDIRPGRDDEKWLNCILA